MPDAGSEEPPEGSLPPARPGRHLHLSRRSFLAVSTAAVAAGGAAVVLGSNRGGGSSDEPVVGGATASPSEGPSHIPPTARGGVLRAYNFDAQTYDSVDPHLTQFGPVVNTHSAIFSRLLRYEDEVAGAIAPDLAIAMPEQPDDTTYVFKIRDGIRFHTNERLARLFPATAGRLLTADDVRLSIDRQRNGASPQAARMFRRDGWDVIERLEVPDANTLIVRTREPMAPMLELLAGRHAFVLPREVVGLTDEITSPDALIGSGPFMLDAFEDRVAVRLRRNPEWFRADDRGAGDAQPYLDEYHAFFSPQEDAFQRAAFDRRIVDQTGFTDPGLLGLTHKTNLADIMLEQVDAGGMLAARLLLDRPPFLDDRARRALHLALDRNALIDLLYPQLDGEPSAKFSGTIAPGATRWAGDAEALVREPGYRSDTAGREQDLREAKLLWSAALGSAPVDLRMIAAGIPRTIPDRAIEALRAQLQGALGVNFIANIDPSGTALIAAALQRNLDGATEGAVTFTLMLEDGGVDLDDWLYPHFRSGARMNTYRLQDPQLDDMLERQRREFDADTRRQIGLDAQEYLLANANARLEICAPVERRLVWGYVRNSRMPLWNGANQELADVWLDSSHAAFEGRPVSVP